MSNENQSFWSGWFPTVAILGGLGALVAWFAGFFDKKDPAAAEVVEVTAPAEVVPAEVAPSAEVTASEELSIATADAAARADKVADTALIKLAANKAAADAARANKTADIALIKIATDKAAADKAAADAATRANITSDNALIKIATDKAAADAATRAKIASDNGLRKMADDYAYTQSPEGIAAAALSGVEASKGRILAAQKAADEAAATAKTKEGSIRDALGEVEKAQSALGAARNRAERTNRLSTNQNDSALDALEAAKQHLADLVSDKPAKEVTIQATLDTKLAEATQSVETAKQALAAAQNTHEENISEAQKAIEDGMIGLDSGLSDAAKAKKQAELTTLHLQSPKVISSLSDVSLAAQALTTAGSTAATISEDAEKTANEQLIAIAQEITLAEQTAESARATHRAAQVELQETLAASMYTIEAAQRNLQKAEKGVDPRINISASLKQEEKCNYLGLSCEPADIIYQPQVPAIKTPSPERRAGTPS